MLQNVMFLKKKCNYHETIHDGAIGIKETIWYSAIGMKSLCKAIVSWNNPSIAGVIDFFDAMPSRANFLRAVAFSKGVWD